MLFRSLFGLRQLEHFERYPYSTDEWEKMESSIAYAHSSRLGLDDVASEGPRSIQQNKNLADRRWGFETKLIRDEEQAVADADAQHRAELVALWGSEAAADRAETAMSQTQVDMYGTMDQVQFFRNLRKIEKDVHHRLSAHEEYERQTEERIAGRR